ncbi:hypothetical protein DL98DRAFT_524578 [Cadophora sp. DSE1049]|nr:hypothetical protein DL98DRAFT_524578 [Cadophora sp. DSE1049]
MPYTSTLPLMKERAESEGLVYWNVRAYYTECLMMIQSGASGVPQMTPDTHQYRAENQAWSYFWPEDPFPGIDPQPGLWTLGAERHFSQPGCSGSSRTASSSSPNPTSLTSQPQRNTSKDGSGRMLLSTEYVYPPWTCGNCREDGHTLADCTRNLDSDGFLTGCPKCNTQDHSYDSCQDNLQGQDPVKDYHFLVFRRSGKPPIRTRIDVRSLGNGAISKLRGMPQTSKFALDRKKKGLLQNPDETIIDPTWMVHPEMIKDQSRPSHRIGVDTASSNLSDRHMQGIDTGAAGPIESMNPNATPGYHNHNSSALGAPNTSGPVHTGFPPPFIAQQQQVPPQPDYGIGPMFQYPAGPALYQPPPQNQSLQMVQQPVNFQNGNIYASPIPLEHGRSFPRPVTRPPMQD